MATVTQYPGLFTPADAAHPAAFGNTGDPDGGGALAAGSIQFTRSDANPDSTLLTQNDKGWHLASMSSAAGSAYEDASNFNFGATIPIGSVINSITAEARYWRSSGSGNDTLHVGLFSADQTTPGAFLSQALPNATAFTWNALSITFTYATSGLSEWMSAISFATIVEPAFGARFLFRTSTTAHDGIVDYFRLVADYTPPATVTPADPIYQFDSIRPVLKRINTLPTHLLGFGDSNWGLGGYGHKKAIEKALGTVLKARCRALGLCPMNSIGYSGGFSGLGYSGNTQYRVDDPDTARNTLDDSWGHAFTVESCDWTAASKTITKTGAFAGYTHAAGDQAYVEAMAGTSGVTAGVYTIASATANTLVLSTSCAAADKAAGIRVTEIIPGGGTDRGNVRNLPVNGFIYVADANTIAAGTAGSLSVDSSAPLPMTGALRVTFFYGTFASGTGTFTLQGRNEATFAALAGGATVNPVTGAYGMASQSWSLAPDSTRTAATFGVTRSGGGSACSGPFFGTFIAVEDALATGGFDFNTVYQQGGESALDMIRAVQTLTDAQLDYYLTCRRGSAAGDHQWIILLQSGGNDRNESVTSKGAYGIFPGDSRNAYEDNALGLYTRFRDRILANWPGDTTAFLMAVTHPHYTAGVEDAEIAQYRQAAYHIAGTRADTAVIDFTHPWFGTVSDWIGRYNAGGSDNTHLSGQAAFDEVWSLVFRWAYSRTYRGAARNRSRSRARHTDPEAYR